MASSTDTGAGVRYVEYPCQRCGRYVARGLRGYGYQFLCEGCEEALRKQHEDDLAPPPAPRPMPEPGPTGEEER
jgi:hypothetical protein